MEVNMIEEMVLNKCLEYLDEISSHEYEEFYGHPPRVYYIDCGIGIERNGEYVMADLQKTYKYEAGKLEIVETGTKNATQPVSRMYFAEGHAEFGTNSDSSVAFVNYLVGPRYGRGFSFEIIEDNEGKHLGEEKLLWVS